MNFTEHVLKTSVTGFGQQPSQQDSHWGSGLSSMERVQAVVFTAMSL